MGHMRCFLVALGVAALVGCNDAPRLAETQQAIHYVSPGSYTFPTTQVGNTAGPVTFTVGSNDYTFNSINAITESCADYAVQPPTLPQYAWYGCDYEAGCLDPYLGACYCYREYSFTFTVTYTPTVAGTTSCNISIVADTGAVNLVVMGTATPPPAAVSVSTSALNFGQVRRNTTSAAAGFSITNTGGSNLSVSDLSISGPFALDTQAGGTVAPGGARNYSVTCSPGASLGGLSGSIGITTSAGNRSISLACTGIDSNLELAPSPANIPVARVGEPKMQSIALQNTGAASMNVQDVVVTGAGISMASTPTLGTYAPGASHPVMIAFAADTPGEATGEMIVTYDGGQTRTVAINAQALATSMSVSPDVEHDLGQICVGATTAHDFTVLAPEPGPFVVTDVVPPAEPFTVVAAGLPATVQGSGGNMFMFTAGFAPTAPGDFTSELAVTTDIPGGSPREIRLHAVAIPEGVNGADEVNLGGAAVDTTTLGRSVMVTNCTQAPVTLANRRIEGLDAALFNIVAEPDDLTVEPGGTVEWLVVFRPDSGGRKTATFVADDGAGGSVSIPLVGDGLTDESLGPDQSETTPSYYACSTSSATAVWPLALALPLVLRRRRRRAA